MMSKSVAVIHSLLNEYHLNIMGNNCLTNGKYLQNGKAEERITSIYAIYTQYTIYCNREGRFKIIRVNLFCI